MIIKIILMFAAGMALGALALVIPRYVSQPKSMRHLQIFYLPVALIAAIASCASINRLLDIINNLLTVSWLHSFLTGVFPTNNFSLSFMYIVIVLLNLLAPLLFTAVMLIARVGVNVLLNYIPQLAIDPPEWTQCRRFYDFSAGRPPYVLKRAVLVRKWLTAAKYTVFAAYGLALLFICIELFAYRPLLPTEAVATFLRKSFMMPLVLCAFITQCQYFLLGAEENEPVADKRNAQKVSSITDYDALIGALRKDLAPALLAQIFKKRTSAVSQTADESLNAMYDIQQLTSEASVVRANAQALGARYSSRYISAMNTLLDGGSVIINDVHYGEFYSYLVAVLAHLLSQGRTAIFICTDSMQAESVARSMERELTKLNGVAPLWSVRTHREHLRNSRTDVLVCSDTELVDVDCFSASDEILNHLGLCVFCDALTTYSGNRVLKSLMLDRLNSRHASPGFVFFTSAGSDDFDARVRNDFGVGVECYESGLPIENLCLMVWRGEGLYKTQSALGLPSQAHLGTALTIAAYAAKYNVERVSILPAAGVALDSYKKLLLSFTNELGRSFFGGKRVKLDEIIQLNAISGYSGSSIAVNIIHDVERNIAALLETWLKYGGDSATMLHIISDDYLLRDYFCDNIGYFYQSPSIVKGYIPYEVGRRECELASLLIRLYDKPMLESELLGYARALGFSCAQQTEFVDAFLQDIFDQLFPEMRGESIYRFFTFRSCQSRFVCASQHSAGHFESDFSVRFVDSALVKRLRSKYNVAQVVHDSEVIDTLSLSAEDIYAYYLPGQIHAFNGTAYRVNRIMSGKIYVETANDILYCSYEPISTIRLETDKQPEIVEPDNTYELRRCSAKVTRTWTGYFKLINGKRFDDSLLTDPTMLSRKLTQQVENANVLTVRLRGDFGDKRAQTAALFCFMWNEIMPSIFPRIYRNIVACTDISGLLSADLPVEQQRILAMLPRLEADPCQCGANEIVVYIVEIAATEYGLVRSAQINFTKILRIMADYLAWALSEQNIDKPTFLKMGFETFPDVFAVDTLYQWLSRVVVEPLIVSSMQRENPDIFVNHVCECSYCASALIASAAKTMPLDRQMCEPCDKSAINNNRQLKKAFEQAKEFVRSRYGIEPPRFVFARLAATNKIKRRLRNRPVGRVLACWQPMLRRLLVERGAPYDAAVGAIVYELVRMWQLGNVPGGKTSTPRLEAYCAYAQIDCLASIGSNALADSIARQWEENAPYAQAFLEVRARMDRSGPSGLTAAMGESSASDETAAKQ